MDYEGMLERLGSRIHSEMNHKKWNIKKLAAESGVNEKVISRLIRFDGNPELKTLDKIATALKITLEDLCNSTGKHEL